ncbi:hypothetical protein RR48_05215 [Papilio machaon]|uniref:FLYWCH-type domain-containing protein n=1 Tax=Papilio machaon TaxID=76193 RepID=A0A0N1PFZ2_PAPMA|nr:hypothetical protein RR48_05215 [Papilio machaon]
MGIRYACCSRLSKNCPANVHVSKDNVIIKSNTDHNHTPPSYFFSKDGRLLKTDLGAIVLLYKGHTFRKNNTLKNSGVRYGCCSKDAKKCPAYIHLSKDNVIIKSNTEHNHKPPRMLMMILWIFFYRYKLKTGYKWVCTCFPRCRAYLCVDDKFNILNGILEHINYKEYIPEVVTSIYTDRVFLKYQEYYYSKVSNSETTWRCVNTKSCFVRVVTTPLSTGPIVLKQPRLHNHPPKLPFALRDLFLFD